MFIKTIVKTDKKTGKRYNYYRLCESYRIGNKIRHRSIVSMGRLDGIETREDKKLLADTIEALIHGEPRLSFFETAPEITRYAQEFAKRITDEKLLDAGIMTEDNAKMLKQQDYDYICVNRTKLKDYTVINQEQDSITIYDKNKNPIELRYIAKKDCPDNYLYVRSQQKAVKEASMNEHFSQHYEEELENIKGALYKKGGTKKLEKVWERIGPAAARLHRVVLLYYNNSI